MVPTRYLTENQHRHKYNLTGPVIGFHYWSKPIPLPNQGQDGLEMLLTLIPAKHCWLYQPLPNQLHNTVHAHQTARPVAKRLNSFASDVNKLLYKGLITYKGNII